MLHPTGSEMPFALGSFPTGWRNGITESCDRELRERERERERERRSGLYLSLFQRWIPAPSRTWDKLRGNDGAGDAPVSNSTLSAPRYGQLAMKC
jgi:hypothetical protein